jgi:2-iminobutanoate/2-iminopropanoate deaminase
MARDVVNPKGLAAPLGPYSYAVRATGDLLFVSGLVALDDGGNVVGKNDVAQQTEQIMKILQAVLADAGSTFHDVIKVTNYMIDVSEFAKVAPVRARYLTTPYPASTTVEVSRLIRDDLLIEIEAIALLGPRR